VGGYNVWQDLFDTYQSLPDWIKFAWLVVPPLFVLGLMALMMRFGIEHRRADSVLAGKLIYSIYRDGENGFRVVSPVSPVGDQPALLLLDPPDSIQAK